MSEYAKGRGRDFHIRVHKQYGDVVRIGESYVIVLLESTD